MDSYILVLKKWHVSTSYVLIQEEKEAEIKKLRQSLNFKATPMPSFYRGQKVSKSTTDKVFTSQKNFHVQLQVVINL